MNLLSELYVTGVKFNTDVSGMLGRYPFSLPAVRNLQNLQFKSPVTFLVGENGSGKSTLLEAIAAGYGFNPEGGTINFNFSTRASHSELYNYITLIKSYRRAKDGFFLRAESLYNVASEIEELDKIPSASPRIVESYGGSSLHDQSHGESFLALVMNRFGGNGLYLLDEPEAALSPTRQMSLITLIRDLEKLNSQFIIATHSPILMAYPSADIYVMTEDGPVLTPYRETEHYIVTKRFLNEPEVMLRYLIED